MSTQSLPAARERGSVTAEAAVVLPVLLVVLAMAVYVLAAVATQLRCADAAALAARAAARGETPAVVTATAQRAAPGAAVQVTTGPELVVVVVRASVRPLGALPGLPVSGRATAAREDRVAP